MTIFPCINTLFTVDLYGNFRAHNSAKGATGTLSRVAKYDRPVSFGIVFLRGGYLFLFTDVNAQVAFLANIPVDFD
jgi:hypothetical protein